MALSKILPASQEQFAGARNLIINGAMQVAQRGTSTSSVTATGYYCVDRFKVIDEISTAVTTVSQSTDAAAGFENSKKIDVTTANASPSASEYFVIQQLIEAQDLEKLQYGTSAAKSLTLSFYVKSPKTGTHYAELEISGGQFFSNPYTINSANTWEYKTLTFAGNTGQALVNSGTSTGIAVNFWLVAGSTFTSGTHSKVWSSTNANRLVGQVNVLDNAANDFFLTGVQLEIGEQATPFEHRSFADEWDRCQRYCTVYNLGGGNTHPQNFIKNNHSVPGAAGHVDVPNRAEWFMSYPVKRAEPTITVTDPTNMRWLANGNVVVDANGSVTFPVGTSYQSANVFQGVPSSISTSSVPEGWVYKNSGTNPSITIDAEL